MPIAAQPVSQTRCPPDANTKPDFPLVGWLKRNERNFVMNPTDGWMNGWTGGGMWLWAVLGVAVVALLAVVIGKLSKK